MEVLDASLLWVRVSIAPRTPNRRDRATSLVCYDRNDRNAAKVVPALEPSWPKMRHQSEKDISTSCQGNVRANRGRGMAGYCGLELANAIAGDCKLKWSASS
jgi:hypothetical protein